MVRIDRAPSSIGIVGVLLELRVPEQPRPALPELELVGDYVGVHRGAPRPTNSPTGPWRIRWSSPATPSQISYGVVAGDRFIPYLSTSSQSRDGYTIVVVKSSTTVPEGAWKFRVSNGVESRDLDVDIRAHSPLVNQAVQHFLRDELEDASTVWAAAARTASAAGNLSHAKRYYLGAADCAWRLRDLAGVRAALDRARAVAGSVPDPLYESSAQLYEARLAHELGEYRRALVAAEEARRLAWRWALEHEGHEAVMWIALATMEQGHPVQALELLDGSPEIRVWNDAWEEGKAYFDSNVGWIILRGMDSGTWSPELVKRARASFEAAEAFFARQNRPLEEANVLSNRIWLSFLTRELEPIPQMLLELERLDPFQRGFGAMLAQIVNAEILLSEGRAKEALALLESVHPKTRMEGGLVALDVEWRIFADMARAQASLRKPNLAAKSWWRAITALERARMSSAGFVDRAAFLDARRNAINEAGQFMLEQGLFEDALWLGDLSRSGAVRDLAKQARFENLSPPLRAEWTRLKGAALRARENHAHLIRARDELDDRSRITHDAKIRGASEGARRALDDILVFLDSNLPRAATDAGARRQVLNRLAPSEYVWWQGEIGDRAVGFLVSRAGVQEPLPPDPIAALSKLELATHVYVVSDVASSAKWILGTDPNASQFGLELASISLIPDFSSIPSRAPAIGAEGAVVVADPDLTLGAETRTEAKAVSNLLGGRYLEGAQATRSAVLTAVPAATTFYFSGHGALGKQAVGEYGLQDPLGTHLVLADGTLSIADLMTVGTSARLAVLSACESGLDVALGDREAIGFPAAFLASGTRTVLATTGRVDKKAAERFLRTFTDKGGLRAPGPAFRATVRALREAGDSAARDFLLFGAP